MLCDYLPPLEAYEQQAAVQAAVAPHLRRSDYGDLIWDLRDMAAPLYPPPEPPERDYERRGDPDPEKAAEWFRSIGARVVDRDGIDVEAA